MPYLDVQGRTCGFMNFEQDEESGRFFRRYFVISPEDGAILCYMDNPMNLPEAARRPILDIQLTNISNARVAEKQRPKVEYCFVVTTSKRDFFFQADNHRDMDDWVNRINNASKITVPSTIANPGGLPLGDKNGGDMRAVSYKTEVVGGVVIRTPVQPGPQFSESDSDDDVGMRNPTLSRSPEHGAGSIDKSVGKLFPGRNILQSGWCVKQGAVRKSWKRRYFILDDQGISYYKSDQEKIHIRSIPLKEISSCRISEHGPSIQRDNLFEIVSALRTFYVQAYSPDEMESWVQAINNAVAAKKRSLEQSMFVNKEERDTFL
ncbi:pleckstrin homology domain-containing family A member 1-like [Diadema setosum]|uniref:pleckstrin homology domain-containing family A member 1-like n=1 Tax=Diadema setosum TaxID=31175 RepID=UPI003B3A52DF